MTREEAIKWLEETKFGGKILHDNAVIQVCDMAISAIREQEERENGCEYCTDSKNIYHLASGVHDSMDEDVYISGNALVVDIGCNSYGSADINYCPMCGRRLQEPPKEYS